MSIIHKEHSRYGYTGEQNNSVGSTRNHTRITPSSVSSLVEEQTYYFRVRVRGIFRHGQYPRIDSNGRKINVFERIWEKISWPKPGITFPQWPATDCEKIRTASFPALCTYWTNSNGLKGSKNSNEKSSFILCSLHTRTEASWYKAYFRSYVQGRHNENMHIALLRPTYILFSSMYADY
jgi:hypothetical protein